MALALMALVQGGAPARASERVLVLTLDGAIEPGSQR
jgi:hypothetical protein